MQNKKLKIDEAFDKIMNEREMKKREKMFRHYLKLGFLNEAEYKRFKKKYPEWLFAFYIAMELFEQDLKNELIK